MTDPAGYIYETGFVFCDWQRDGTLSAGRSAYINYCGILQQFVEAYISKQKVKDTHTLSLKKQQTLEWLTFCSFLWIAPLVRPLSEFRSVERGAVWRGSDSAGVLRLAEWPLTFPPGPGVSGFYSTQVPDPFLPHGPVSCSSHMAKNCYYYIIYHLSVVLYDVMWHILAKPRCLYK